MPVINISQPLSLLLILAIVVLLIFLGREVKKSYVPMIPLVAFLALLVIHAVQLMTANAESGEIIYTLSKCITLDFVFIFLSFMSYLWIDSIEAKENKKKSIDNSLDWFWSKV